MSAENTLTNQTPAETAPSTGNNPETGSEPEDITSQITTVTSNARDIMKRLEQAVITVNSKGFFSTVIQTDVTACNKTYIDLILIARSTATTTKNLAESFSNFVSGGQRPDNQMVETFKYVLKKLPTPTKFEAKDGKTFEMISSDLMKVSQTIREESKAKLEKANRKALVAEAALSLAEDQLAESQSEYDRQLPQWLADLGLDDNTPKWMFYALYTPYKFLRDLTDLGHTRHVSDMRACIEKIKSQEAAVKLARKKLADALADAQNKQEEAEEILEYQSAIKSMAVDINDISPKLDIFAKVVEMVKLDCERFIKKYEALQKGEGDVNRDAVVAELLNSVELFKGLSKGLMDLSVVSG